MRRPMPPPGLARASLVRCRGENALAELETLVIVGGGSFQVGVNHVVSLLNRVPLVRTLQAYEGHLFDEWLDRRGWALPLYERDARILKELGRSVGVGLSTALTIALPHVAPAYDEPIQARLKEILAEEEEAKAWRAKGILRRWSPPPSTLQQVHFVNEDEDPALDVGIGR